MIRKHKKFKKPKKMYDLNRIKSENLIVSKYGLKSKREIWKAKAKLDLIRNRAKKLIDSSLEDQEKFVARLRKIGFNVNNPVEVLALTEKDILDRRLQTIVLKKNIATTPKGSRQLITHKKIMINGEVVNSPSYIVTIDEENKISSSIKPKTKNEEVLTQ